MYNFEKTFKKIQANIKSKQQSQERVQNNLQNQQEEEQQEIEEKKQNNNEQAQEIDIGEIIREKNERKINFNENFLNQITFLSEQNIDLFQGEEKKQFEELLKQYNKFIESKNFKGIEKFKNKLLDFCLAKQSTVQRLIEELENKKNKSKIQKQQLAELQETLDQSHKENDKKKLLLLEVKLQNIANNRKRQLLRVLQKQSQKPVPQLKIPKKEIKQQADKYIQARVESPPRNLFQRANNFIRNKIRSISRDSNIFSNQKQETFDPNELQQQEIKRNKEEISKLKQQLDQKEKIVRTLSRDITEIQNKYQVKDQYSKKDQNKIKDYEQRYKEAVIERDDLLRKLFVYENQLDQERLTNHQQREYFEQQLRTEQESKNQIYRDYIKIKDQYEQSLLDSNSENLRNLQIIENQDIELNRADSIIQDQDARIRNLQQQINNLETHMRNQQQQWETNEGNVQNYLRENNQRLIQQTLDSDQRIVNLENIIRQRTNELNNVQNRNNKLEREILMLRNQQQNNQVNQVNIDDQQEEQKEDIQSITQSQQLQQKYNAVRNAMQNLQLRFQDEQIQNFIQRLEEYQYDLLNIDQELLYDLLRQYNMHLNPQNQQQNQQQIQQQNQQQNQLQQNQQQQIQFPNQEDVQEQNQPIINRVYQHLTHDYDNYNVAMTIQELLHFIPANEQQRQTIENYQEQLKNLNIANITQNRQNNLTRYRNILRPLYLYLQSIGYNYRRR